eukprot:Nk52_evm8s312 gene=Nk52_evmTU8s312
MTAFRFPFSLLPIIRFLIVLYIVLESREQASFPCGIFNAVNAEGKDSTLNHKYENIPPSSKKVYVYNNDPRSCCIVDLNSIRHYSEESHQASSSPLVLLVNQAVSLSFVSQEEGFNNNANGANEEDSWFFKAATEEQAKKEAEEGNGEELQKIINKYALYYYLKSTHRISKQPELIFVPASNLEDQLLIFNVDDKILKLAVDRYWRLKRKRDRLGNKTSGVDEVDAIMRDISKEDVNTGDMAIEIPFVFDWYVLVTYVEIKLTDFSYFGPFWARNFQNVVNLRILVKEETKKVTFSRDMLSGLTSLQHLEISVVSSIAVMKMRNSSAEVVPDFLSGLTDQSNSVESPTLSFSREFMKSINISIPYGDLSSWQLTSDSFPMLENLAIVAALPPFSLYGTDQKSPSYSDKSFASFSLPLPSPKKLELGFSLKIVALQCTGYPLGRRSLSKPHPGVNQYFSSLCSWHTPYGYKMILPRGLAENAERVRVSVHLDASHCNIAVVLDSAACPGLISTGGLGRSSSSISETKSFLVGGGSSVSNSSTTVIMRALSLIGFVVNDYVLESISVAQGMHRLALNETVWLADGQLNTTARHFEFKLRDDHASAVDALLQMGREVVVSARIWRAVINLKNLCGQHICSWISIDGGAQNGDDLEKPELMTTQIISEEDNSAVMKSSNCSGCETDTPISVYRFTRANVANNTWDYLNARAQRNMTSHTGETATVELHLDSVGNLQLISLFPCIAFKKATAASPANSSECDAMPDRYFSSIQILAGVDKKLEGYGGGFELSERLFYGLPNLTTIVLADFPLNISDLTVFESPRRGIALVNNYKMSSDSLKDLSNTSYKQSQDLAGVWFCQNNVSNAMLLLNDTSSGYVNISRNRIGEFNLSSVDVAPCSENGICGGIVVLDVSHNEITSLKLWVYRLMWGKPLTSSSGDVDNPILWTLPCMIDVSNNHLTSVQILDSLPDNDGKLSRRNFTSAYGLYGGRSAYENLFCATSKLHLSLASNALEHIPGGSFDNLINLSSLDLSRNSIHNISGANFLSRGSCKCSTCSVDLSYNKLYNDKDLDFTGDGSSGVMSSLNLAHNNLTKVPRGLGDLAVRFKNRMREMSADTIASTENALKYFSIDLSNNNITDISEPLCSYGGDVDGFSKMMKRKEDPPIIYIDLSNNNLNVIEKGALDCGNVLLMLNINHNPITLFPEPSEWYNLWLLSAADTDIVDISFDSISKYSVSNLKSIFISKKMKWKCCDIFKLDVESSFQGELLFVNLESVSGRNPEEPIDIYESIRRLSDSPLTDIKVTNQRCALPDGKMTQYSFQGAIEYARMCSVDEIVDDEYAYFILVVVLLCEVGFYATTMVLVFYGLSVRQSMGALRRKYTPADPRMGYIEFVTLPFWSLFKDNNGLPDNADNEGTVSSPFTLYASYVNAAGEYEPYSSIGLQPSSGPSVEQNGGNDYEEQKESPTLSYQSPSNTYIYTIRAHALNKSTE